MTQVTEADRDAAADWLQSVDDDGHTYDAIRRGQCDQMDLVQAFARYREQAVQEAVAELKPWRDAIDEALVRAHIGTADSFPDAKTALHKLICWEIDVALDPRVSDRARDLVAGIVAWLRSQYMVDGIIEMPAEQMIAAIEQGEWK